jgi:hypothetical protein
MGDTLVPHPIPVAAPALDATEPHMHFRAVQLAESSVKRIYEKPAVAKAVVKLQDVTAIPVTTGPKQI